MRKLWLFGLIALGSAGAVVLTADALKNSVATDSAIVNSATDSTADSAIDDLGVQAVVEEQAVVSIPLVGPIADRAAEISGLAWWGDRLILLPQYPTRMGGQIFALEKADIVSWLNKRNESSALVAEVIIFEDGGLSAEIAGFEGYEAIAFQDNTAFLTIESATRQGMMGYVVSGSISEDGSRLTLNSSTRADVRSQSSSPNKSEEALLLTDAQLLSIYEVNGAQINRNPIAHTFNFSLAETAPIPFPQIEYRITDATDLDARNRFWAINYFYSGDRDLLPEKDPLAIQYGEGETHQQRQSVERLVEFAYAPDGITMTDTPPIQLALEAEERNWEGIVRLESLDEQGFLLVTDKFPETILGFVEKTAEETPE